MRKGVSEYNLVAALRFLSTSCLVTLCASAPSTGPLSIRSNNNPLGIDWDPAPPPEKGPPASAGAIRDPAYLPAQIGGIVGSYALSLVLVALLLLALNKKRRDHLEAANAPEEDKAGLLDYPLDSGSLMKWGAKRRGKWVSIFASKEHVYMIVAGLRFGRA